MKIGFHQLPEAVQKVYPEDLQKKVKAVDAKDLKTGERYSVQFQNGTKEIWVRREGRWENI